MVVDGSFRKCPQAGHPVAEAASLLSWPACQGPGALGEAVGGVGWARGKGRPSEHALAASPLDLVPSRGRRLHLLDEARPTQTGCFQGGNSTSGPERPQSAGSEPGCAPGPEPGAAPEATAGFRCTPAGSAARAPGAPAPAPASVPASPASGQPDPHGHTGTAGAGPG